MECLLVSRKGEQRGKFNGESYVLRLVSQIFYIKTLVSEIRF